MLEFLTQHSFWSAIAAYWIVSAAISAMPAPMPNGSPGYTWLYQFLHTIAGNLTTAFGSKIPGLKTLTLLLLIPICLSASACHGYLVHPGSLNKTDSAAYDSLIVAQAAIDQGRTDFEAGKLPASSRDPLNKLILSYNVTREAWLTYRGALSVKAPPDLYLNQLVTDLTDLKNAIVAFKGVK